MPSTVRDSTATFLIVQALTTNDVRTIFVLILRTAVIHMDYVCGKIDERVS